MTVASWCDRHAISTGTEWRGVTGHREHGLQAPAGAVPTGGGTNKAAGAEPPPYVT